MKRLISILLVTAMVATLLAGCSTANPTSSPASTTSSAASTTAPTTTAKPKEIVPIRFATLPNILALPFYYISQKGWDVENGFKLDIKTFSSGAPINEALGAKLWDVSAIGAAGILSLCKYGAYHVLEHSDAGGGGGIIIRKDSPIATVKGINPQYPDNYGDPATVKGKTLIVPVGGGSQMQALLWLDQIGVKPEEVKMVDMNFALGYQSFTAGQGDMVSSIYPQTSDYLAKGYMFASTFASTKLGYYDNTVVAKEFYENPKNWDTLVALMTQLLRADDAFLADETLYLDTLMAWYKQNGKELSRDVVLGEIKMKPFVGTAKAKTFANGEAFLKQADFYLQLKTITAPELEIVKKNTKSDLLKAALAKMGK